MNTEEKLLEALENHNRYLENRNSKFFFGLIRNERLIPLTRVPLIQDDDEVLVRIAKQYLEVSEETDYDLLEFYKNNEMEINFNQIIFLIKKINVK